METSSQENIDSSAQIVGDFRQEMLALIFSLRMGPVLRDILNDNFMGFSHVDELRNYLEVRGITVDNEFILRELDNLKHTFRYLQYDLEYLWKPGLMQVIKSSSDMPEDVMYNYVQSMSEIGNACTFWDFRMPDTYLKDKVVLDFGCGNGFFYGMLRAYFKEYVGYDRPEVITNMSRPFQEAVNKDVSAELIFDEPELDLLVGTFDTIWLSQVVHSKSKPFEFIRSLEKFLKSEGGTILVCGIKKGSPVSIGLNSQLRIHSGVEGMSTHLRLEKDFKTRMKCPPEFNLFDFGDNYEVVSIEYCAR